MRTDESLIVDGRVDVLRTRPPARLGYMDGSVVDSVFAMDRPDDEVGERGRRNCRSMPCNPRVWTVTSTAELPYPADKGLVDWRKGFRSCAAS